jgi:hypothetical protein
MGIVPWRKDGFFLRVMGRMRMQVIQRVVLILFCVAFLVLAGVQCKVVRWVAFRRFGFMSWCHNFVILLLTDKPEEGTSPFPARASSRAVAWLKCLN